MQIEMTLRSVRSVQLGLAVSLLTVSGVAHATKTLPGVEFTPPPQNPSRAKLDETCTIDQQAIADRAIDNARVLMQIAIDDMQGAPRSLMETLGRDATRHGYWLGAYARTRYDTVIEGYQKTVALIDSGVVATDCSCTREGVYAYVYASTPTIYLCPVFWQVPALGTDSQSGAVVHELSHLLTTFTAIDSAYGTSAVRALAASDPDVAVKNADSLERMAENVPELPMPTAADLPVPVEPDPDPPVEPEPEPEAPVEPSTEPSTESEPAVDPVEPIEPADTEPEPVPEPETPPEVVLDPQPEPAPDSEPPVVDPDPTPTPVPLPDPAAATPDSTPTPVAPQPAPGTQPVVDVEQPEVETTPEPSVPTPTEELDDFQPRPDGVPVDEEPFVNPFTAVEQPVDDGPVATLGDGSSGGGGAPGWLLLPLVAWRWFRTATFAQLALDRAATD